MRPEQILSGRKLLKWSRERLAEKSDLTARTIADIELKLRMPRLQTLAAIRVALEAAGVEFTNGDQPAVRLKRPSP